jgi:hypothetical protein
MNINQTNNEIHESTYALLVRSEEKERSLLENNRLWPFHPERRRGDLAVRSAAYQSPARRDASHCIRNSGQQRCA